MSYEGMLKILLAGSFLLSACMQNANIKEASKPAEGTETLVAVPDSASLRSIAYIPVFPCNLRQAPLSAYQRDLRMIKRAGFNAISYRGEDRSPAPDLLKALEKEHLVLTTKEEVGTVLFVDTVLQNTGTSEALTDVFRRKRESYFLSKSQNGSTQQELSPFVHIHHFNRQSDGRKVKVYSNCQEVELIVNGLAYGRQRPDSYSEVAHLQQPPFTFMLDEFHPGTLEAQGFINNQAVVSTSVRTPLKAHSLKLKINDQGLAAQTHGDLLVIHAHLSDVQGTLVPESEQEVLFRVGGDAILLGPNPAKSTAGTASVFLQTGLEQQIELVATCATLPIPTQTIHLKLQNHLSDEKQ